MFRYDKYQKEKRVSEDEMAGQQHWCNEHKPGQTLGDGEGQGGLACWGPQGLKESDMTGWPKNNNNDKYSNSKKKHLREITCCIFLCT